MADTSIVTGTIAQFIDGALIIAMLMIIYYIVRFFTVPPPTEEKRAAKKRQLEEQRTKFGEWLGGKLKERKVKAKKEQRKGDVSVAKENIKDALEGLEDIHTFLNQAELAKAKKTVERVKRDLHHAVSNLRLLRRKHEGADRQAIQKAIDQVHLVEQNFLKDVERKLPAKVDPNHTNYVNSVKDSIDAITLQRGNLGNVWNMLEDFHENIASP